MRNKQIPEYVKNKYDLNSYFTALYNRLDNYVYIFNLKQFPFKERMLGFPFSGFDNEDECFYRIKELCELLQLKIEVKIIEEHLEDGVINAHKTIKVIENDS